MKPSISMAPLRGVTISEFRRLYGERFGGIDYAVTPFIPLASSGNGGKIHSKLLKDIIPEKNGNIRIVPQVIGKDPNLLQEMAKAIKDLGYNELNLNCGCPWKFVANKGRGSGLPEDEDNLRKMLEAGCNAMPNGFSVKIRLGRKDTSTLKKRAVLLSQFPLTELIIHPRTATQMYEGEVYVEEFAQVLPDLNMPIVYNGDIKTLSDYRNIVERFPSVTGIMIGRGLIANPTLPESIKTWEESGRTKQNETHDESRTVEFLDALYEEYKSTLFGPSPVLGRMKELWLYAHVYISNGATALRNIQRCKTLDEYEKIREQFKHFLG